MTRALRDYDRVLQNVVENLVEPQLLFVADPCRWRVADTSRQAGKNYAVARLLILTCLEGPDRTCVYVNDTFRNARDVMWADQVDGLPAVCRELDLEVDPNETRMELRFSNGSIIQLLGADRGAWDQLRGRKLDLIVADEMQRYEDEGLRAALSKVIPDCLMARKGSFVGIGTPDQFCIGTFFELCESTPPGWTRHHWTSRDLDGVTEVWKEQLAWAASMNIDTDPVTGDPDWCREKLGMWVRDVNVMLFPLSERSVWQGDLPSHVPSTSGMLVPRRETPRCFGGIDFGFTGDPAAVVLFTVSNEEGVMRETYSEKRGGLLTPELAQWLRDLIRQHGVQTFYADNADPKTIAELSRLHGLPVVPCVKHTSDGPKELWINEMRGALRSGRLQVRQGSPLHTELETLTVDPDALRRKLLQPKPGSDDHCTDSFRYCFRGVHTNHISQPKPPETHDELERRLRDEELRRELGQTDDETRTLRKATWR